MQELSQYQYIFLDLDGTVIDSALGVTNSVAYALSKLGYTVSDRSELMKFIGPPLSDSFSEFYGFDDERIKLGIGYYREYYTENGIFECSLYDHVEDLLKAVKRDNRTLALATSKPEVYARRILERINIDKYFDLIAGSTLDGVRNNKSDVLRYALGKLNIEDASQAVLLGDRKHDVIGAHEFGMPCVYMLHGYGNEEEAVKYNADMILDDMSAACSIIS